MTALDRPPLVIHVVYRFATGGLENGVVNLINRMPSYRHMVIALTEVTDFRQRIVRDDVTFVALNKPPGHAFRLFPRLYGLFRQYRPAIVHTRNLGSLEAVVPAWAAGVPVRIHGEHGRDVGDFDGSNRKYQWVRRIYQPFVTHYLALSKDLERYLTQRVGIAHKRVAQVYNGVDADRFLRKGSRQAIEGSPFRDSGLWLIGTVGRMQIVKDQTTLAQAFVKALEIRPDLRATLRLIMVGDGPLRHASKAILDAAGLADLAWLPGERNDVPEILRGLDCFVLPSLGEGISNTILEAMASSLPVIATAVGGNGELVETGVTGQLVPAGDPEALARALVAMAADPAAARRMGDEGRRAVERRFSLDSMVASYRALYDKLLSTSTWRGSRAGSAVY